MHSCGNFPGKRPSRKKEPVIRHGKWHNGALHVPAGAELKDTVDGSTSKTIDIGDLAPREEKTGTIQFNIPKDDYHEIEGLDEDYDYGYLDYANFVLSVGIANDVFGFIRYASESQIKKFGKTSKIITSVGDNITVKTGDIVDMNLSVDNEDTSGIKYKVVSSNNDVVSTNDLGILRGIGEGNCTVTVYAMPFDDEVVLTGGKMKNIQKIAWETLLKNIFFFNFFFLYYYFRQTPY